MSPRTSNEGTREGHERAAEIEPGGYVEQNTFDWMQNEWVRILSFGNRWSRAILRTWERRHNGRNTFIPLVLAVQSLASEHSLAPTIQKEPRGSTTQKAVKDSLRGYAILCRLLPTLNVFVIWAHLEIVQGEETRGRFLLLLNCQESLTAGYATGSQNWASVKKTSLSECGDTKSQLRFSESVEAYSFDI